MNLKYKLIIPIMVLLMLMIPLNVYSAVTGNNSTQNSTNSSFLDNNNLSQNNTTLLNVPYVNQPSNFTSGPTSLQAVIAYYGSNTSLDELINMTNSTSENGTLPGDIVQTANNLGFNAVIKENMTLEDLQMYVIQGIPVIVDAQAWKNNATNNQNWTDDQNNSHYMIVIGIDTSNVYFEDPAILGSRGYIPNQEFLDRWHDTYEDSTGNNTTNIHLGIIITGKQSVSFPLITRIN
ncbi:MAG: C39 family peptidase [Methanobacterium sp.]